MQPVTSHPQILTLWRLAAIDFWGKDGGNFSVQLRSIDMFQSLGDIDAFYDLSQSEKLGKLGS